MAARNGCLECIQLLIAAGANLHAADRVRLFRVEDKLLSMASP